MASKDPRYSKLAPLTLRERVQITPLALSFFSPMNYQGMCTAIGKTPNQNSTEPLRARDFIHYLEKNGGLPDAGRYTQRINELLANLVHHNLLQEMGKDHDVRCGTSYYFLSELTGLQRESFLWLAPALGAEFIYEYYSKATIQITGKNSKGDVHAGTGIIIAPNWILTCAHVLNDMNLDSSQYHFDSQNQVKNTFKHASIDVGFIEMETAMHVLHKPAFRDPIITETVFTLGYPRVPLSQNAALIMQRGDVTNPNITLFGNTTVFLYSATARPGNSGGPIISESGHVVGIVTTELSEKSEHFPMPFHAGIKTNEIIQAIKDLEIPIELPTETYE
jgi:Trypsin-like peptidase domain